MRSNLAPNSLAPRSRKTRRGRGGVCGYPALRLAVEVLSWGKDPGSAPRWARRPGTWRVRDFYVSANGVRPAGAALCRGRTDRRGQRRPRARQSRRPTATAATPALPTSRRAILRPVARSRARGADGGEIAPALLLENRDRERGARGRGRSAWRRLRAWSRPATSSDRRRRRLGMPGRAALDLTCWAPSRPLRRGWRRRGRARV